MDTFYEGKIKNKEYKKSNFIEFFFSLENSLEESLLFLLGDLLLLSLLLSLSCVGNDGSIITSDDLLCGKWLRYVRGLSKSGSDDGSNELRLNWSLLIDSLVRSSRENLNLRGGKLCSLDRDSLVSCLNWNSLVLSLVLSINGDLRDVDLR